MTTETRPAVSKIKRLDGVRPTTLVGRVLIHPAEWLTFSEITITGQENLDQVREGLVEGKKIVFVSNHESHADGPAIYSGLSRNGYSDLAKKSVFIAGIRMDRQIATQILQRRARTIQVWPPTEETKTEVEKRTKDDLNWKAIRAAKGVLREGRILVVFPQSTRSEVGKGMGKAFPEVAGYLKDSYVVPIAVIGTDIILPRGKRFPKRGEAEVSFGSIIDIEALEKSLPKNIPHAEIRQKLVDLVMGRVADLLPERLKGYYAIPR